jgi:hypothetical protein
MVSPGGSTSVKDTPVNVDDPLGLLYDNVIDVVPTLRAIDAAPKVLVIVGGS